MKFPYPLPLVLDGATGTNLISAGLKAGECVESFVLTHPEIIKKLQSEFISAGSNVIYAPTFSANRAKLEHFGLENQVDKLNGELVTLSKSVATLDTIVAGDMSPTGFFLEPFGDMSFSELLDIYREQAKALKDAGADYIALETMLTLPEMRAGVMAANELDIPIAVTMTVDAKGKTISGTDCLSALIILQSLGAAAFGLNCCFGPDKMLPLIKQLAPFAQIPLIAKPNAGAPNPLIPNQYDLSPDYMAEHMRALMEAGVTIVGGCCGSTPAHIAAIRKMVDSFDRDCVNIQKDNHPHIAATESEIFFLDPDMKISPPLDCAVDMSDELIDLCDEGYDVLAINVKSADDGYRFSLNAHMARLPVMFIAANADALEYALRYYNGLALVDSKVELELESLKSIAEKYGALVY